MSQIRPLFVLLALGLLLAGGRTVQAHTTSPPMSLDFEMVDNIAEGQLVIELGMVETWIGASWEPPEHPTDPESLQTLLKALLERCTITINNHAVTFKGESVVTLLSFDLAGAPGGGEEMLKLLFTATLAEPAHTLHINWTNFAGILWEDEHEVPILIMAERRADTATLTPEEHLFDWRRRPPAFNWSEAVHTVDAAPPPLWSLPVPALAVLLVGMLLLLLLILPRWRTKPKALWTVGCLALGALLIPVPFARYEIRPLFGAQGVLPAKAQAEKIFTQLHNNIYRAFANPGREQRGETRAEREARIYEILATSVMPELIDALYVEVAESLNLREQNGVVCYVDHVELVGGKVRYPDEEWATHFHVDWHWRVHGSIEHLKHIHRRINIYRARYLLQHDGASWRIGSIEVLEHRRLDENEDQELELETVVKHAPEEDTGDEGDEAPGSGSKQHSDEKKSP